MEQISKKAKVVGTKQVLRALAEGRVSLVYLAADADEPLRQRVREACAAAGVEVREVPSMAELGKACSVAVKTAAAALLAESFG